MSYPQTVKSDIVDGAPIDMAAKVLSHSVYEDGNENYVVRDLEGNTLSLRIFSNDADGYDFETGSWYVFENARGDVYNEKQQIGSNYGKLVATKLDEPPVEAENHGQSPLGNLPTGGVVAVDIETVSTVDHDEFSFENSEHVELLAVGVGYARGPDQPGDVDVFLRDGPSASAELELLERLADYVDERAPASIVVFKGDFDIRHIPGRAAILDEGGDLYDRLSEWCNEETVTNLDPPGSLEENADVPETHWDIYRHSLTPADWRKDHPNYYGDIDALEVTNKDVPYFGDRYLELCEADPGCQEHRALEALLRHYTSTDIYPLFEMVGETPE